MSDKYQPIRDSAVEDLRDRCENYRDEFDGDQPHDVIHEIADSHVPIYYSDIFAVLADLPSWELSDPGIAEGAEGLDKIAQIHIYDALSQDLFAAWGDIRREQDDDES